MLAGGHGNNPQEGGARVERIELPTALKNRAFTGWPELYLVSASDTPPPPGVPFIRGESIDQPLIFRLLIPILMKKHGYFDWLEIYHALTGTTYVPERFWVIPESDDGSTGHTYYESDFSEIDTPFEELAASDKTYVDIDMLADLKMLPVFMDDIREAISVNVTNNYAWTDGYNKKLGICVGSLTEQPQARNLVILDISGSIPDGVSTGMLTLIRTISDITNADLIITGGTSKFYTNEEAKQLDIRRVRRECSYANEGKMFNEILRTRDMNYRNIICFGDSDNPESYEKDIRDLSTKLKIENIYSFFCMEQDRYNHSYRTGAGYCRWAIRACPDATVHHHTDWARYFTKEESRWR